MTPPELSTAETPPQTIWECCLVWADLLINLHVDALEQSRQDRLSEEDTALFAGVDRPLVSLLIAAALHERVRRLELSFTDAVFVPIAAPQEEGVSGTLRRSPYNALVLSPDLENQGRPSRVLLLKNALASHPDDRLLWDRVRTAALTVVDAIAASTRARHTGPRHPAACADGPYWERGITIGDVLLGEQDRRQLEGLAEIWGDEH
ncbi:hypothetical protein [Streptomyces sp. MP131-18]|uniref:hypothetical protein n=1 Tax=Streptomyces sp. MP131-18 TaxID=1857892 RepID=UPI00097CBB3E|nr:hypothetical protein [Streptomyces sp. MP131-18]ONK13182.1 hypothetical protein STBA_39450 [Streptomyces sp. MP131-18]